MECECRSSHPFTPEGAELRREAILVAYDPARGAFFYPEALSARFDADFDGRPLWRILPEAGICSGEAADRLRAAIERACAAPGASFEEFALRDRLGVRRYCVGIVCAAPGERVSITLLEIEGEIAAVEQLRRASQRDALTGLMNRSAFCSRVEEMQCADPEGVAAGEYAMIYLDVFKFKAINDVFGISEGDLLLRHIANTISRLAPSHAALCRPGSDSFLIFTRMQGAPLVQMIESMLGAIADYGLPTAITCGVGIYMTGECALSPDAMIDRAILAQAAIEGSYTTRYNFYTEALRAAMLSEQEISGMMEGALKSGQFVVYYQPQYNHATGMLVGAEALVRWQHPERGLIPPRAFIPIFESNGFIVRLDLCVFEQVCAFLRRCMDEGLPLVPVSSNFSRHDFFQAGFVEKLEEIRARYGVPAKYLRVEITESVVMSSSDLANEVVRRLHAHGYIVEMDDFGSGYSSLNVLKDIELDVIKLDMLFISEKSQTKRGGVILSSVIRMAKWLGVPVIAEGVEQPGQADFLCSIGCNYMQGYLYSRPVPPEDYVERLKKGADALRPQLDLIDNLNANNFWDPDSQETLIFNHYVGGAAIFEYRDGRVEVLRVNKKYLQELCMNLTERDLLDADPMRFFDAEARAAYIAALDRAIQTGDEQECETWRTLFSSCCGTERVCIRSTLRKIGRSGNNFLFYAMIRNITAEREQFTSMADAERRFRAASEQANIYFWEYTVATREMRPCFRCMRDLGLPPLMTNYPESAIEMGVFPPEVADLYRDWHRQIAAGAPFLEAVMPLTAQRVPFHVRYTTEFDECGRPVRAYGSATKVV